MTRLERAKKEEYEERQERLKMTQDNKMAFEFRGIKLKRLYFLGWRTIAAARVRNQRISTDATSANNKSLQENNLQCDKVTDTSTSPTLKNTETPRTKRMDTAQSRQCNMTASSIQRYRIDKENQQPNMKINDDLLSPNAKPRKPKPMKIPQTPKLLVQMEKRQKEREMRREVLRSRYEQAVMEKKRRQEEELRKTEAEELRVHQEYMARKAEEAKQKKLVAERWKHACRLAVLHYKMSVMKRMFRQWKRIFEVIAFNERKVNMHRGHWFRMRLAL